MADTVVSETVRDVASESAAVADDPLRVAVRVAAWSGNEAPALAVKVAEVALAATLTEEGTVNAAMALLDSATRVLPAAAFDSVTVQVVLALAVRLVAAHCREDTVVSVVRESVADWDALFNVAVTVAL
jgi:hypothetical protein